MLIRFHLICGHLRDHKLIVIILNMNILYFQHEYCVPTFFWSLNLEHCDLKCDSMLYNNDIVSRKLDIDEACAPNHNAFNDTFYHWNFDILDH